MAVIPSSKLSAPDADGEPWRTGWTKDNPISLTYHHQTRQQAVWTAGPFSFLERRDLGLAAASQGKLGAFQFRMTGGAGDTGWHAYDVDFDFTYILKGSVSIETEGGQSLTLTAHSSALQPRGLAHRLSNFSSDFQAVTIRSPATAAPIQTTRSMSSKHGTYQVYSPDLYQRSTGANRNGVIVGLRPYLAYRQFGVIEATGGRLNIHESRVIDTPPKGGTGWHKHASSNWYMVLSGHNEVGFEHLPETFIFSEGDAFSQGPNAPHVVGFNTLDYAVLAISIPASYATIPLATPEGFQFKYGERGVQ